MKNKLVLGGILGVFQYFAPVGHIVAVVMGAILLDFVFALVIAFRGDKKIVYEELWKTPLKMLCCLLLLMLLHSATKEGLAPDWNLPQVFGGLVVGFEVVSLLRHMYILTGYEVFRLAGKIVHTKMEALQEDGNAV
jgi:hypothetical protein